MITFRQAIFISTKLFHLYHRYFCGTNNET